jgi:Uma2 family endonuclease
VLPGASHKPEPDVAVTREPITAYVTGHPGPDDLLLVAEASDSTLTYDLENKGPLYADAGIAEYWVIDLVGRRLIVHREPSATGYQIVTRYGEAQSVSPLAHPEASVIVSTLLPRQQIGE